MSAGAVAWAVGIVHNLGATDQPSVPVLARADDAAQPEALVDWDELNAVLAVRPIDGWQLQVLQGGRFVPPDAYGTRLNLPADEPDREHRWRMDPNRLVHLLHGGATMQLRNAHQLLPSVERLRVEVERLLACRVGSQLWLAGGSGLSARFHWDGIDVVALQLGGSKAWEMTPPQRRFPLVRDLEHRLHVTSLDDPSALASPVDGDATLHPGDALYVPRGWWHRVWNVGDGPVCHLSLTIRRPTGRDLLEWLADELLDEPHVRRDIARPGAPSGRAVLDADRLPAALLGAIERRWHDDVVAEYLAVEDALAPAPRFSLPEVAGTGASRPAWSSFRSASTRRFTLQATPAGIEIRAVGRVWMVDARLGAVLAALLDECRTIGRHELARFCADGLDVAALEVALNQLVTEGLLVGLTEDSGLRQSVPTTEADATPSGRAASS